MAKDDLYSFSTADSSCSMVQTTGDVPSPRVGHASALVSSVLIVWGGDTDPKETDVQDNSLYLLNLGLFLYFVHHLTMFILLGFVRSLTWKLCADQARGNGQEFLRRAQRLLDDTDML